MLINDFDRDLKIVSFLQFIQLTVQIKYFISNLAEEVTAEKEEILTVLSDENLIFMCTNSQKKQVGKFWDFW